MANMPVLLYLQANVLANACSKNSGNIAIQASAMSSGMASAYANVFAAALAKACTCNPLQCKCPAIPFKVRLNANASRIKQMAPAS